MIDLRLQHHDLARIRFARSPIWEVVASLRVIARPGLHASHHPWLRAVGPRVARMDLGQLHGLAANLAYVPDFLTPSPTVANPGFACELERVRATPPEAVAAELDLLLAGAPPPAALRSLYDHPARQLGHLVGQLAGYWRVAVDPFWPRIRALLDADLAHRSGHLTTGGVATLLDRLHPLVSYDGDELHVASPGHRCRLELGGGGIVLLPCAFAWPGTLLVAQPPYQPALAYTPRGGGRLWDGGSRQRAASLGPLLGHGRAALLSQLDLPWTTTALAERLAMSRGTVSQHLKILRDAGLVTARRSGREVLYQRTSLAASLIDGPAAERD